MNIKEIKMKKMFLFMSLYVVYNYNVISALTERKIGSPIVLLTGLFLLIIMGFLNKQFDFTWDRLKKPIIFISIFIVYLILNLFLKGKFDGGSIVKFGEFFMICVVGILIFSSSMNKDDLKDIIKVFFILNTLIFIAFVLIYHNHWIYRMSIGWRLSTKGLNATWLGRFFAETAVLCILTVDNKIVKYMYSMILFLLIVGTGSKSVIIGLLLVYLIVLLKKISNMLKNKSKIEIKKIAKRILIILVPISIIGIILTLKYVPLEFIIGRLNSESTYGGAGRMATYGKAIDLFKSNPIMGCGLGNYFYQFGEHTFSYPHNIILEYLSELGIIGVVFFAMFIYVVFKNIKLKTNERFLNSFYLLFFMYLINAMFSGNNTLSNFQLYIISFFIINYNTQHRGTSQIVCNK